MRCTIDVYLKGKKVGTAEDSKFEKANERAIAMLKPRHLKDAEFRINNWLPEREVSLARG